MIEPLPTGFQVSVSVVCRLMAALEGEESVGTARTPAPAVVNARTSDHGPEPPGLAARTRQKYVVAGASPSMVSCEAVRLSWSIRGGEKSWAAATWMW